MTTTFYEDNHVFIVRIWLEPREIKGKKPEMRGVVEHMTTGNRAYFKNLYELIFFLLPYLEEMGIETDKLLRLQRWVKR